jgi:hypothetical protein
MNVTRSMTAILILIVLIMSDLMIADVSPVSEAMERLRVTVREIIIAIVGTIFLYIPFLVYIFVPTFLQHKIIPSAMVSETIDSRNS